MSVSWLSGVGVYVCAGACLLKCYSLLFYNNALPQRPVTLPAFCSALHNTPHLMVFVFLSFFSAEFSTRSL